MCVCRVCGVVCCFFFKQKTAYEMRISDWSSDVCSSDLVSHFVAALSGDTDVAELRRLAVFGETETARLEEVQRQIKDLQSKSVAEAIKQLDDAKRDIAALQKRLTDSGTLLTEEKPTGQRAPLATFADKDRLVAAKGADSFNKDFFKGNGKPEWDRLL